MTLERPIGSMPMDFQKLPDAAPENRLEREQVAMENHNRANQVVLAKAEIEAVEGLKIHKARPLPAHRPRVSDNLPFPKNHQTEFGLPIQLVKRTL